jgi:hypothetical protein
MIRDLIQNDQHKLPNLAFHSMNLCEDFIVIYGGMSSADKVSGDLIFLKMNKDKFMIASYENNKSYFPKPRHSHSAVYSKLKKKLYIFGGIVADNPKYVDDLWTLEVSSKPAFNILPQTGISNRCRSVVFICKNRLYIYGGYGINKITKKYQILNDLFLFDLEKGPESTREVVYKGGVDMVNFLFKCVRLTDEETEESDYRKTVQYAFFCSDLSLFFIFDTKSENFIKIQPKFFVHGNRENFTVEKLSDGRIILFGGMNEDSCYNEAYSFVPFYYQQKDNKEDQNKTGIIEDDLHWAWNDLDLYGMINDSDEKESGYNGHASILLPNDHIFIFGGTEISYFPVYMNAPVPRENPRFTRRCKIIDIFNTYTWDKPLSKFYFLNILRGKC